MIKDAVYNEKILKELLETLVVKSDAKTDDELTDLRNLTLNVVLDFFNQYETPNNKHLDFISSDEITVEVKDKDTNKIFRRTLDMSYIENSNGIKMQGEDLKGNPSEIVFLSNPAINKIIDVTGKGLNKSRCHD